MLRGGISGSRSPLYGARIARLFTRGFLMSLAGGAAAQARLSSLVPAKGIVPPRGGTWVVQTTCGRGGKWLGTRRVPPLPGRREIELSRFRPDADAVGIRIEPGHEPKARDLPTQEQAFKTSAAKTRMQPKHDIHARPAMPLLHARKPSRELTFKSAQPSLAMPRLA